jgi:hypothetical protein
MLYFARRLHGVNRVSGEQLPPHRVLQGFAQHSVLLLKAAEGALRSALAGSQ